MHNAPAPKIGSLWPLAVMILIAGVQAAESTLMTDIPASAVAAKPGLTAPEPPTTATLPARADAPSADVERYQNSINELQKTRGAYAEGLGEELVGLGLAYKNLEQYPQALAAFNRALHVTRVNHGLQCLEQIPILEQIIAANTAQADWAALEKNYHYLYWVNRRSFNINDPQLLPVIDRLARWHLNAYRQGTDPLPYDHLIAAHALLHDAITLIETAYSPYDRRLINPLYGIAMVNYQMTSLSNPEIYELVFNSSYYLEADLAVLQSVSEKYRAGRDALLRIVEVQSRDPESKTRDLGMALMHLGDWHLLFNRRNTANETYAQAYARLAESGMSKEDINKLFSQPYSMPIAKLPLDDPQVTAKNAVKPDNKTGVSNYVVARFDVSETGWARNIKFVESSRIDKSMLRRAKRTIRETHFRPRLEDGQPVETTDVNIRYVFQE